MILLNDIAQFNIPMLIFVQPFGGGCCTKNIAILCIKFDLYSNNNSHEVTNNSKTEVHPNMISTLSDE